MEAVKNQQMDITAASMGRKRMAAEITVPSTLPSRDDDGTEQRKLLQTASNQAAASGENIQDQLRTQSDLLQQAANAITAQSASISTGSTLPHSHTDNEIMKKMAGAMGYDPNNENTVTAFLQTPVTNVYGILHMLAAFHREVTTVEITEHVMKLEGTLELFEKQISAINHELRWMSSEHRQAQRRSSSTQSIVGNWPNNAT